MKNAIYSLVGLLAEKYPDLLGEMNLKRIPRIYLPALKQEMEVFYFHTFLYFFAFDIIYLPSLITGLSTC